MRAALLVSRQSLYPTMDTPWVRSVCAAVEHVQSRGITLLTTIGMPTWEIILVAARERGAALEVLIPVESESDPTSAVERVTHDFELRPDTCHIVKIPENMKSRGDCYAFLDSMILTRADLLFPIAVRKGGRLAHALACFGDESKLICPDFQVVKAGRATRSERNWEKRSLRKEVADTFDGHLIHWTRGLHGPWPGERKLDYYRAVLSSEEYPRNAIATLMRIAQSRRIIASARHMSKGTRVVSFSATPIFSALSLMKWRSRYREMSFEPYGIAFAPEVGHGFGLVPVQYGSIADVQAVPPDERWRWQSAGKLTDWRREREYRHNGDFTWEEREDSALTMLVPERSIAKRLSTVCKSPVEWLFDD